MSSCHPMKTFWFPSLITTIELAFVVSTTLSVRDSPLTPKSSRTSSHDCRLSVRSPGHPPLSPSFTRRNYFFSRQVTTLPGVPGRANRPLLLEERKQKPLRSGDRSRRQLPPSCPRPGRARVLEQMAGHGGGFPQPSGDSLGCRPRKSRQHRRAGSSAHFLSQAPGRGLPYFPPFSDQIIVTVKTGSPMGRGGF